MSDVTPVSNPNQAEIQRVIDSIVSNPSEINSIIERVKENKDIFRGVMDFIGNNPDIKNKAMSSMIGKDNTMKSINKMSMSEKRQLMKKAKDVRREISNIDPKDCSAVMITMSRKSKNYKISTTFPTGTRFSSGMSTDVSSDIRALYITEGTKKNKKASKIVGEDVFGDVVFYKEDENGNIVNLLLEDFQREFPEA